MKQTPQSFFKSLLAEEDLLDRLGARRYILFIRSVKHPGERRYENGKKKKVVASSDLFI